MACLFAEPIPMMMRSAFLLANERQQRGLSPPVPAALLQSVAA
jgi:hypothetical protein